MLKKLNLAKIKNYFSLIINSLNKNKRKNVFFLFVIILGVIVIVALILFFVNQESEKISFVASEKSSEQSVTKKITPLAQGKQIYFIRTDNPKNPQIIQVSFDPLDVKMGEEQILTVKIKHSNNESITNKNIVTAIYYTDNGSSTAKLKLRRADGPPLTTIWEGTWMSEDTHNYIYQAAISAVSASGNFLTTLSFR